MMPTFLTVLCFLGSFSNAPVDGLSDEKPRMNQIQVIGTHNSYHIAPDPSMMEALLSLDKRVREWQYTHDPLDVQLTEGLRSFELDLHPSDQGYKILHVPLVDEGTHCLFFKDCLAVMLAWSQAHPEHVPVSVLLEFKLEEAILSGETVCDDPVTLIEALQNEILESMPEEKLLTPRTIHSGQGSLREVLEKEGWPHLERMLGKFFFILHDKEALRNACESLSEETILFVNSSPDRSDGAVIVVDDPFNQDIPQLLEKNMIVRVRADSGLRVDSPRALHKRDQALASGAHIVSTDFPCKKETREEGYCVSFPDKLPARSNPVTGTEACHSFLQKIKP